MKPVVITDFAPRRAPKRRTFKDLIPGIFLMGLCITVPAPLPQATTAAALPPALLSPVPTTNLSLLPTISISEMQAGASATEGSDSVASYQSPSVEPSDPVQIIRDVFGPDAPMALAIARAESGLNCGAYSPTNDAGLLQVNLTYHAAKFGNQSPYDCLVNAKVAKEIFDASGWGAWATYNNGSYRRFL